MCPRFVTNSLDDDLHVAEWRYELDKVADCIEILGQRVAQCGTPELSF
jgi:hypothetical protein